MDVEEKYNSLTLALGSMGRVVIAYSGGVDSTFLLKVAVDALGAENVLACIGVSPSLAVSQKALAIRSATKEMGITPRLVEVEELADEKYSANAPDRCFHCKSHLFGLLRQIAKAESIQHVLCGNNFDDKDDYRPGTRAAEDYDVVAPLAEAGLTKDDIRLLSRRLGLATADMPASPCLASRVSYGEPITEEKLKQIELAEEALRQAGFVEFRVRHHGDIARIEVPPGQIAKIAAGSMRKQLTEKLKALGFKFVTLDLQGFRSGSLNETLTDEQKQRNLDK